MPEEPQPDPNPLDLMVATPEEIAEVLSYALRYDERGKPRLSGWDFVAGLAAERLTIAGWFSTCDLQFRRPLSSQPARAARATNRAFLLFGRSLRA
jgi:hypothetical protein